MLSVYLNNRMCACVFTVADMVNDFTGDVSVIIPKRLNMLIHCGSNWNDFTKDWSPSAIVNVIVSDDNTSVKSSQCIGKQ